jgi:hypothetical protein
MKSSETHSLSLCLSLSLLGSTQLPKYPPVLLLLALDFTWNTSVNFSGFIDPQPPICQKQRLHKIEVDLLQVRDFFSIYKSLLVDPFKKKFIYALLQFTSRYSVSFIVTNFKMAFTFLWHLLCIRHHQAMLHLSILAKANCTMSVLQHLWNQRPWIKA